MPMDAPLFYIETVTIIYAISLCCGRNRYTDPAATVVHPK